MTHHEPAHANPAPADQEPAARRGRRAFIAAGATAAVGAVGVALARPADAAAGSAFVLGRANSAGAATTSVTTTGGTGVLADTGSNIKWGVHGRNIAATSAAVTAPPRGGVRGEGRKNIGVRGDTTSANMLGVWAINSAAVLGDGAALVADGGANPGVVAFTDAPAGANAQPALWADGGPGGWASLAFGDATVFGGSFASTSWLEVTNSAVPEGTSYAPVVSAASAVHTAAGVASLTAGAATVNLGAAFADAASIAQASIQLTAVGASMPNLFATPTGTGFTIGGGTATGSVSWTVTAPRTALPVVPLAAATATPLKASSAVKAMTTRRTVAPKPRPLA